MGFLDNIVDKANAKSRERAVNEVTPLLIPGESLEDIFLMNEDYMAFTDRRILLVDNKLVSSKKSLASISYNKITAINLAKGGAFTLSKEVEIHVGSHKYEFKNYDENEARKVFVKLAEKTI